MRRFIPVACAGLLAAAMALPSFAADMPGTFIQPAAGSYVAPFGWTGLYIGVNGGYGFGSSNWTNQQGTTGDFDINGAIAGGTIGYNLQTGVWVWGLEADLDYSWMKGSDSSGTGVCAGVGCETKNTYLATGRGRIGYAFDRWLPYVTGGAAYGGIKMTPNTGLTETKSRLGWTLGGGVEYAFLGAWSAKLEYLYVDLGKSTCSAGTCGIDTDVKFKESIVRAGLNYRF